MSDKLQFPTNKWAAMATSSIVDTATTHLAIYDQPLKPATIQSLSFVLGGIVEEVARETFMGGFDWSFDATSRIVYSLGQSLRNRPAPFGQDQAAWETWRKTLVGLTSAKLRIAIPMVDYTEFGAPNFEALIVNTTVPNKTAADSAVEAEPALA